MKAAPLTLARDVSSQWVGAIAPAIPGFRPKTHKRNVIVFLCYLLVLLFGVHAFDALVP